MAVTAQEGIILPMILLGVAFGSVVIIGMLRLTGTVARVGGLDTDQLLELYGTQAGISNVVTDLLEGKDALALGYPVPTTTVNGLA